LALSANAKFLRLKIILNKQKMYAPYLFLFLTQEITFPMVEKTVNLNLYIGVQILKAFNAAFR